MCNNARTVFKSAPAAGAGAAAEAVCRNAVWRQSGECECGSGGTRRIWTRAGHRAWSPATHKHRFLRFLRKYLVKIFKARILHTFHQYLLWDCPSSHH